jgi:hypothetical protein
VLVLLMRMLVLLVLQHPQLHLLQLGMQLLVLLLKLQQLQVGCRVDVVGQRAHQLPCCLHHQPLLLLLSSLLLSGLLSLHHHFQALLLVLWHVLWLLLLP